MECTANPDTMPAHSGGVQLNRKDYRKDYLLMLRISGILGLIKTTPIGAECE